MLHDKKLLLSKALYLAHIVGTSVTQTITARNCIPDGRYLRPRPVMGTGYRETCGRIQASFSGLPFGFSCCDCLCYTGANYMGQIQRFCHIVGTSVTQTITARKTKRQTREWSLYSTTCFPISCTHHFRAVIVCVTLVPTIWARYSAFDSNNFLSCNMHYMIKSYCYQKRCIWPI
jgi:hypothetical protein